MSDPRSDPLPDPLLDPLVPDTPPVAASPSISEPVMVVEPVPTIPAATVVVVRPSIAPTSMGPPAAGSGIDVLLLRRNAKLAFAGGHWVFPGGRVDLADRRDDDVSPDLDAARRAAVREAAEEAGLILDADELVRFAHWTPPTMSNKRFATWFFVTALPFDAGGITIDGGEIHEHTWIGPAEALRRCDAGEIELSPPTWITLEYLSLFDAVDPLLAHASKQPVGYFATRIAAIDDAIVALYDGDAGYDESDASLSGTRHRLWMRSSGWVYERDDWPPPLN